jgi:glycosyltransferase involved in cell wall biosynthesis
MRVSIILPLYNAEKFLRKSVESLLYQTFTDLEILAINDGSNDTSVQILESFGDSRIKIINNEINRGLIYSLNRGLNLAAGDYIARMDADDISFPQRIERQVAYLEANPEIDIVSSDMVVIDENNRQLFRPFVPVTNPILMQWMLLRRNMLYHPTVMIRRNRFLNDELFYDPEALFAEDYELWLRLSRSKKLVNQDEVLLQYRRHGASVTQSKLENQLQNSYQIVQKHIEISYRVFIRLETLQIMNRPMSFNKNMNLNEICSDLKLIRSKFPTLDLIELNFQGLLWQILLVAQLKGGKDKNSILKMINLSYFFSVIKNAIKYLMRRSGIKERFLNFLISTSS